MSNNNAAPTGAQPTAQGAVQAQQQTAITPAAKESKEMVDSVMARVATLEKEGALKLPKDYNAGNALRSAWLYLQGVESKDHKPALQVCTPASIANALLEMVLKGETVAKSQCYFIVTGNTLTFWEDYRGKYMRARRDTEIERINPQVVYEGDEFVYTVDELGQLQLVKHTTSLANINIDKIVGAYAVVIEKDGKRHLEVMSMTQIRNSWNQGQMKGQSGAHKNFTDQMCKKTIIARACKIALGASDDSELESDDVTPPDTITAYRASQQQVLTQEQAPVIPSMEDAQFEEVKADATTAAPAAPQQPKNECPI